MLDPVECDQTRVSRNRDYDGRFFTGVRTKSSVQDLATRLGVGARHLSRLFQKHVGARPIEVAKTVRVQRAKRLIDETDLPLSEIAFRAGFGSVRRFNAVFAEVYKRQPGEIRRGKRTSTPGRK